MNELVSEMSEMNYHFIAKIAHLLGQKYQTKIT